MTKEEIRRILESNYDFEKNQLYSSVEKREIIIEKIYQEQAFIKAEFIPNDYVLGQVVVENTSWGKKLSKEALLYIDYEKVGFHYRFCTITNENYEAIIFEPKYIEQLFASAFIAGAEAPAGGGKQNYERL